MGQSKIQEGGKINAPKDFRKENKVALCVFGRGKRPSFTGLEDQVDESGVNNARIDIPNVEIDESTIVDNKKQFEIQVTEVTFLTKWTNKVKIEI